MSFKRIAIGLAILVLAAGAGYWWLTREPPRVAVLTDAGGDTVLVMDFSRPFPLDPLPPGWHHREFWTRAPADFAFAVKDGTPSLRVATADSASMLFRFVDIDLAKYPILRWRWLVEKGIDSDIDERTREGDDHPARLFLRFVGADGERRAMEIVWGNKDLKPGEDKMLGTFPHYVANAGAAKIGNWHDETVDLLALYRRYWKQTGGARLVDIAIFCDSDETDGETVSYFADVRLTRR